LAQPPEIAAALEASMQFQFDMSSSTLPAVAGTSSTEALTGQMMLGVLQQMLDVQKQCFTEIINIQREQLNHARALHAENLNRWRTVLQRWTEHYPELPGSCKTIYPVMEKAYLSMLDNLSQELIDQGKDAFDSEFALQEFIDKNGQKLGQFGHILSVIGPISEIGAQQQQAAQQAQQQQNNEAKGAAPKGNVDHRNEGA
jgi:hypothetical protein